MKTFSILLIFLIVNSLSPVVFAREVVPGHLTVRDIMAEPSIAGTRPEGEKLSPDGKWVAYLWNDSPVAANTVAREPALLSRDLFLISTAGGTPIKLATNVADANPDSESARHDIYVQARETSLGGIDWSADSRRLLYSNHGDIFVIDAKAGSVARRITHTVSPEIDARWMPDNHRVLYQSSGSLFVMDVDQTSLVQLTRENGSIIGAARGNSTSDASSQTAASGQSISNVRISNDGMRLAVVVSDNSKQRNLVVTDYTGDFVTTRTTKRGWSDQLVEIVATDGSGHGGFLKLPLPEGHSYIRGIEWSPDDFSLAIDRVDKDTKRRQLFRVDATSTDTTRLVFEDNDPRWIASISRIFDFNPGTNQIFTASEADGFNRLYLLTAGPEVTAKANDQTTRKLTTGDFEVNWAKWTPDAKHILYSSDQNSTAERHFYLLDVDSGASVPLDNLRGMNTDPQLSKDGRTLLFQHSEWNRPDDLYAINVCAGCGNNAPRQLTNTVPAAFSKVQSSIPNFISIPTKDGKQVKARLYQPSSLKAGYKYPVVIFVHGAGYLQNVVNGWNNYYREAMFNQLLTEHGYFVLDLDYRGSSGYGREWRSEVYDFLGGLDLQDHLDGIDYLIKNYPVDSLRVGMYGGSYGGFMAEMAAMRAPEHINCAAALRPVADWKNYYASSPIYTAERLGFPDQNKEAYKKSSPISYAEQLSRPLLILHGMVDDNVHFQDSVQLVQKLIEAGKTDYFEVMFYPKENHSFTRQESWIDEYQRILNFFEAHLKQRQFE